MPSDPAAWTLTRRSATAHGEIAWDRLGDGPPVVLVHGTPSRSVLWRDVAPLLPTVSRSMSSTYSATDNRNGMSSRRCPSASTARCSLSS